MPWVSLRVQRWSGEFMHLYPCLHCKSEIYVPWAKVLLGPDYLDPICRSVFVGSDDISLDERGAQTKHRNIPKCATTTTESEIRRNANSAMAKKEGAMRK